MANIKYKGIDLDVNIDNDEIVHVFYSCPMDTEADIKEVLETLGADMGEIYDLAVEKMRDDASDINFKRRREDECT